MPAPPPTSAPSLPRPAPPAAGSRGAALHRLAVVLVLGFASGLPLALTGQAMQAWLSLEKIELATIGFLSLVGLPYTFKFLWAPLMDRFDLPLLGRRRGWIVLAQLALAAALWLLASVSPTASIRAFALLAVLVAFLSASQDVVVDAYRTDLVPPHERGLGASLYVLGYRLAMIVSGGVALIWTDAAQGGGHTWPEVYRWMAGLMAGAALFSALLLPKLPPLGPRAAAAGHDLLGFLAVVVAVVAGALLTDRLLSPLGGRILDPLLEPLVAAPALRRRWIDLVVLLAGIGLTLPLAAFAARRARFETLLSGLGSYFAQPGAAGFLVFIVLYKLGDAFAGSLLTPFLLTGVGFPAAEVGLVNKLLGLWLTIAGTLLGGLLMLRIGLMRALLAFGVLQMASNLGFWWLAVEGQGALPGFVLPAFDAGFVSLAQPTAIDGGLLMAVAFENLSGGMGTAAFVAFLMGLTSARFSATQFALLSAFASVGRVWVGPLAGVLAESIGWPAFFVVSTLAALPGLVMLWAMRAGIGALEVARPVADAGD